MKLCLNLMVLNEASRIERCLASVAPWIDYYVIADTGSTDGTQHIIEKFFGDHARKGFRPIRGKIVKVPFENWAQARNAARDAAVASQFGWDYLLLIDADMQLIVEDKHFKNNLKELSHNVTQRGGGYNYSNRRFLSRQATGRFQGVTHEYLDVAASDDVLPGVWMVDHADGSNRPTKQARDIKLLTDALAAEPNGSLAGRYWFYLAQTYREQGRWADAAPAYQKRIDTPGGWAEEKWFSRYCLGMCYEGLKDEGAMAREYLAAYNERPWRAEPLWQLAKYYRIKGMNFAALACAEEGMRIPYPKSDQLFVSDYCYSTGCHEEFAICAYYDPPRRGRGASECNKISLMRNTTEGAREQAKRNLFHYLQTLATTCPSFKTHPIKIDMPTGYVAANPSVTNFNGKIVTTVRGINYTITEEGRYVIGQSGECATAANPIDTRNFLVHLDNDFNVETSNEILKPVGFPEPVRRLITGFEDPRLFVWKDQLWTHSVICEMTKDGWCEQILARLDRAVDAQDGKVRFADWKKICPEPKQNEKNWMAQVVGDELRFHYRIGQLIDLDGKFIRKEASADLNLDHVSGGSPLVPFKDGWVAIVHEARPMLDNPGKRYYQHRFAWFNKDSRMERISGPFYFSDKGIEYAAGMSWHPDCDHMMISYSVKDREAFIATVEASEIEQMLWT